MLSSLSLDRLVLNHLMRAAAVIISMSDQRSKDKVTVFCHNTCRDGAAVDKIHPSFHISFDCGAWRPANTKLVIHLYFTFLAAGAPEGQINDYVYRKCDRL